MNTRTYAIIFGIILLLPIIQSAYAESEIPEWVKNNAGWWSEGLIGDSDFVSGIQFLIKEGIMVIPETKTVSQTSEGIPDWVKNNAGWWSEGLIGDSDFVSGIQFLIEKGIMVVDVGTIPEQRFDVIVIGAGIAGLAAANDLDSKELDVILLEARDRIGGRMWTDHSWEDLSLELGAGWIHGVEGNPITEIAEEVGIKIIPFSDTVIVYDSSGDWIEDQRDFEMWDRFVRFEAFLEIEQDEGYVDTPLQEAVEKFIRLENMSEEEKTDFLYTVHSIIEGTYAADAFDLSLWYFDYGLGFPGGDAILPGGYDQIINVLADGLDIKLEHVVKKVEYDDQGVSVTTSNGVFEGDYVLSTLPLGVLKSGDVEFSPPLPQNKIQALQKLEMGTLNRCYLFFSEVFWDEEYDWIGYIPEEGKQNFDFLNVYKYVGKPVILAFSSGEYARSLEKLSDEEIVDEVMAVLENIYGDDLPNPTNSLITRWNSEEFTKGSYSYAPVGATPEDFDILAEPVMDRVFFAGEATEKNYRTTVHGAYLSGIREAERIQAIEMGN